LSNNKVVVFLT